MDNAQFTVQEDQEVTTWIISGYEMDCIIESQAYELDQALEYALQYASEFLADDWHMPAAWYAAYDYSESDGDYPSAIIVNRITNR
jgi:hypothetical protein